jgi:hypothetical protein
MAGGLMSAPQQPPVVAQPPMMQAPAQPAPQPQAVAQPQPTVQPPKAQTPTVALDTYKRLFSEARDLTQTARLTAQKHRRYYDGKIDPKLLKTLRRKRQPDFTINRVRPGVEGLIGVVDRGKSDPRAYPRTPQDQDVSDVATDALRYVADLNRWHQNKLKVFRNILIEGTAAVLVEVDGNSTLDCAVFGSKNTSTTPTAANPTCRTSPTTASPSGSTWTRSSPPTRRRRRSFVRPAPVGTWPTPPGRTARSAPPPGPIRSASGCWWSRCTSATRERGSSACSSAT